MRRPECESQLDSNLFLFSRIHVHYREGDTDTPELWVGCHLSGKRKLKHQQGTSTSGGSVGGNKTDHKRPILCISLGHR